MSKRKMTDDEFAAWVESPEGKGEIHRQYMEARRNGAWNPDGGKVKAKLREAGRLRPAPSAQNTLLSIRIPEADLQKARAVAERKGIPYQTYIKMVLHEALSREPGDSDLRK